MKKRLFLSLIGCFLAISIVLSGCGRSGETDAENAGTAQQTEQQPQQESQNITMKETENSDLTVENTDESASDIPQESEETEADIPQKSEKSEAEFHGVEITFDFQRTGTQASNQVVVWIEDEAGNLVKTIYVSRFTANGGYEAREDALKTWVGKADAESMGAEELDAVSGATPTTGAISFIWDGTDESGEMVDSGNYAVKVEGTLYWSSYVLFEGVVHTDRVNEDVEVNVSYSEDDSTNREMLRNVQINYLP